MNLQGKNFEFLKTAVQWCSHRHNQICSHFMLIKYSYYISPKCFKILPGHQGEEENASVNLRLVVMYIKISWCSMQKEGHGSSSGSYPSALFQQSASLYDICGGRFVLLQVFSLSTWVFLCQHLSICASYWIIQLYETLPINTVVNWQPHSLCRRTCTPIHDNDASNVYFIHYNCCTSVLCFIS
jgi:hypothetical protein